MTSQAPAETAPLSSGALCKRAGVTRGMLRVYEREGLLGEPPRSAAGYRAYPGDAVQRLLAIRQLKEVGFTLREIAFLLSERDFGRISPTRIRQLAREQIQVIDQRIARLQVVREYAAGVAAGDLSLLEDPECRFLLQFLAAGHPPPQSAAPHKRREPVSSRNGSL